jgi:hypothetical protein
MMSAVARIEKARALLQRGRYAQLLDEVTSRVLPAGNPVLYWDRFVIVELADARPPRRRVEQATVLASPADLEALCLQRPDRAELYRRRVREGQRCQVIHDGQGRIAARGWVIGDQPSYFSNSGLAFVPAARPALWCHDIFVEPEARMRGHFVALILNALTLGPDGQRPRLYGEIHFLNEPSIRAHLNLGYRLIRTVTVLSLLGLKVYRIEDGEGRASVEAHHAWRVRHI